MTCMSWHYNNMTLYIYFCSIVNLWLKVHNLWPRLISNSHIIGRLVATWMRGACSCSGCGYSYCWKWGRSVHVKHFSINAALVRDHQACRTPHWKIQDKRGQFLVSTEFIKIALSWYWQNFGNLNDGHIYYNWVIYNSLSNLLNLSTLYHF